MATEELDILFLDFDHIDHAGHSYGYGPDIPEYLNTIEDVDGYIGWVISAMESRLNFENEEWLVIITSDHGGNISGHGGQTIEERTIPIILSSHYIDNSNKDSAFVQGDIEAIPDGQKVVILYGEDVRILPFEE